MDDQRAKAFDFAADVTKQLLTLATAIVAFTITFSGNFSTALSRGGGPYLGAAWVAFLVSIIFGLWTLLALTGTVEPSPKYPAEFSIRGANVRIPAALQILTFLTAVGLTIY